MTSFVRTPAHSRNQSSHRLSQSTSIMGKWISNPEAPLSVFSSCHNDDHPASAVLEKSHDTFFMSTGMYPQEFIIGLKDESRISEIKITTKYVKSIVIERIVPNESSSTKILWKEFVRSNFPDDLKGHIQVEAFQINNLAAQFLRFTILGGFSDFFVVYSVRIKTAEDKWL